MVEDPPVESASEHDYRADDDMQPDGEEWIVQQLQEEEDDEPPAEVDDLRTLWEKIEPPPAKKTKKQVKLTPKKHPKALKPKRHPGPKMEIWRPTRAETHAIFPDHEGDENDTEEPEARADGLHDHTSMWMPQPRPWAMTRVNFYSIGRKAHRGEFNPHDDVSLGLFLEGRFKIMDPAIYDVKFFTRDGNRYGKCWGENITMMQNVAKSKEFQVLIRTVRPLLESKVSQGAELHNVVFTCNQGRHRSVAAAKLFRGMLGTQPGRA